MPRTITRSYIAGLLLFLIHLPPAGATAAAADIQYADDAVRMEDVQKGSFLVETHSGLFTALPTLHTDVHIRASGMISKTTVVQKFSNDTDGWIEGIYVFPLPQAAAVTRLRLRIGERLIRGIVKEREAARRIYKRAKMEGKKTGLVEQQRPNLFTTSVANIAPGDIITAEIDYVDTIKYDNGTFSLRFPMVVGPRYIPGKPIHEAINPAANGWAMDTDIVRDAAKITPPVSPRKHPKINPIQILFELDAGFPLANIDSSYHKVDIEYPGKQNAVVRLSQTEFADRDFEIVWRPHKQHAPRAALFTETIGGEYYGMVMVMPPQLAAAEKLAQARELLIVIDTSGSMHGLSISQAVAAAHFALDQLGPDDTFNIIQFNSNTQQLFPITQPATGHTLTAAKRYLSTLDAQGGTEMAAALHAALTGQTETGRVRQVVFITDGNVGDEARLFEIIQRQLKQSRLFTIGIGSAPNAFFMRRAAEFGRGSYTFIGKLSEVQSKMSNLFSKIRLPVLTDIQIDWPGAVEDDLWPYPVPDLYHGEPLIAGARLPYPISGTTVSGRVGGQPWRFDISAESGVDTEGVSTLWARRKIKSLQDKLTGNRQPNESATPALRRQIVALGTKHHLVTRYTSLIAVEDTPSRPNTERLDSRALATNLPHGWTHNRVFGLPNTATSSRLYMILGMCSLLLALLVFLKINGSRPGAPS